MGYTTDFIGHIAITPVLNEAEQQYLAAFAATRHCLRSGGPYAVPGNPFAEEASTGNENVLAAGAPSFWCQWTVGWDGAALAHDGVEKFYGAVGWLRYLIDHFLAPGAYARRAESPLFEQFTFDHELNGVIAANCRDTQRLYLVQVERNSVRELTLLPGRDDYPDAPLPYEVVRDQDESPQRRRMR